MVSNFPKCRIKFFIFNSFINLFLYYFHYISHLMIFSIVPRYFFVIKPFFPCLHVRWNDWCYVKTSISIFFAKRTFNFIWLVINHSHFQLCYFFTLFTFIFVNHYLLHLCFFIILSELPFINQDSDSIILILCSLNVKRFNSCFCSSIYTFNKFGKIFWFIKTFIVRRIYVFNPIKVWEIPFRPMINNI